MNDIEYESAIAAPLHLVPSREESAHTFKDVLVDAAVCLAPRAIGKVFGPASQRPVQLVTYFWPWIDIARHQKIADPCLEPLHTGEREMVSGCEPVVAEARDVIVAVQRLTEEAVTGGGVSRGSSKRRCVAK